MIEVSNIEFSYGKQSVLKGVNLTVRKGQILSLLGANGAGKTTLINLISGLLNPDHGHYTIDGKKIDSDCFEHKQKVGYVFEKPIYIDRFSANEQLSFVCELHGMKPHEYKTKVLEYLDFFDLPKGNKKYICDYSKGMKSKVSLASALIHEPDYLILDEPFAGMDFMAIQEASKFLKDLSNNGVAILITSHQYDTIADLGTSFALLKKGEIQFNHTMIELRKLAEIDYKEEPDPIKRFLEHELATTRKKKQPIRRI